MKYSKIFRILALAVILSLLVIAIPAVPALAATITLSPTSGPPSTVVTVTGSGFSPNQDTTVTFDGNDIAWPVTTSTGTIPTGTTFTVPSGKAAGSYQVGFVYWSGGVGTNVALSPLVTFTVTNGTTTGQADIDLTPRQGTVGAEVEIDGDDFGDSEDIIVEYDGDDITNEVDGEIDTDSRGRFTAYFIIPPSTAGDHTITVTGEDTNLEAEAEFTVEPEITIDPESGTPNSNVTVTGTGFGRRAQVIIYFAGGQLLTADADTNGSFETTFTVMKLSSGTYDIDADDEDGNLATVKFKIEIEPRADINQTDGNTGTKITISGIAFKAGGSVKITYDDIEVAAVTADSNGAFSAAFDAPASIGGPHTITVTDGTIAKEFTFTMESTPPPIPAPSQPAMSAEIEAKEEAYFDWADAADDSLPVTYTLQIATDRNFPDNSVILEWRRLEASEYTLTEGEWEKLVPAEETEEKKITYYWRVKAIDGASNESEWSGSGSFAIPRSSGSGVTMPTGIPQWAIYALFGLGAVIIGIIGFWLGRRTAYY